MDFDKLFKYQMLGMTLSQSHPGIKRDKFWVMKVIVGYGLFTLYVGFLFNCIINYDLKNRDFFNAFRNGVPIVIFFSRSFCYYAIIRHQKTLAQMITMMKNDYEAAEKMDERSSAAVSMFAYKGLWISNRCIIILIPTVLTFVVKSIFITLISAIQGHPKLASYHNLHYPDIIEKNKDNIFVFVATYMGEMYFTIASALIYFSSIPIGPIFILHACGQLELIKIKFNEVFLQENVDLKLQDIIKHLQYIYKFVDEINKCFCLMYEVVLKNTLIVLPLVSYTIFKSISHGQLTIEYVSIFGGTILMSILISYYSDLLMEKGEEVRQAMYACSWECVYHPSERRTLLIIVTRALKPITITSIFTTINLDTLADVYRQSYTILNLMTAMWN